MKIDEIIRRNGKTLAICSGEEVRPGLQCSQIEAAGKKVDVLDCYVKESATAGILAAYLTLNGDADVFIGPVQVIV